MFIEQALDFKNDWWRYFIGFIIIFLFWQFIGAIPLIIGMISQMDFSDLDKIVFHNLKFAFIDGEHNYKYLIKELNFCKNNMSDNGLIVVDDFNTSDFSEVVECVKKFSNENNYNLKIINYGNKSNFAVINKN